MDPLDPAKMRWRSLAHHPLFARAWRAQRGDCDDFEEVDDALAASATAARAEEDFGAHLSAAARAREDSAASSSEGHAGDERGCRLDRSSSRKDVKVVVNDEEAAASNPKYTWSQTADEVTFEMPVRSQTERGFVCAVIMRKGGGEVERCAKGRAMK